MAVTDDEQRSVAKLRYILQYSKSCLIDEVCHPHSQLVQESQLTGIPTGGRTAWSSTVTVQGQNIPARFWYDGQHVNNAKEEAAEVALNLLNGSTPSSPKLDQVIRKESGELIRPALRPPPRKRIFPFDEEVNRHDYRPSQHDDILEADYVVLDARTGSDTRQLPSVFDSQEEEFLASLPKSVAKKSGITTEQNYEAELPYEGMVKKEGSEVRSPSPLPNLLLNTRIPNLLRLSSYLETHRRTRAPKVSSDTRNPYNIDKGARKVKF